MSMESLPALLLKLTTTGAPDAAAAPPSKRARREAPGEVRIVRLRRRAVLATAPPTPADAGWPAASDVDAIAIVLRLRDGALHALATDGRGASYASRAPTLVHWESMPTAADVLRVELAEAVSDPRLLLLRLTMTHGAPIVRLERDDSARARARAGDVMRALLERVATLRRETDARDAELDAKAAALDARQAAYEAELERRRKEEGELMLDFLPILERKKERLATLEREALERRLR